MAEYPTKPTPANATQCPLCGGDNACAMAAGGAVTDCWCANVTFAAGLLDRLAPEDRGTRCICRQCVEQQGESTSEG